ncbi:hypothetical protein BJX62DRAFT_222109 [Aspergillus germanicus]
MPRPSINLEPYQEEISHLYRMNVSRRDISQILQNRYDIKVSDATIKLRLQIWGVRKVNCTASKDTVLHARIKVLMYQVGLSEVEILHVLRCEGWDIKARTLKYIRHQLRLYRRTTNTIADQAEVNRVLNQLRTELTTGQIKDYGMRMLHQHFKNQGFLLARFILPYLSPYGIEIYAAIDAYSCYIIWIYVGISSRTVVKTILLAEAQHKLQQSLHPEIHIRDCYLYGTSTANQRIEAWWLQLTLQIGSFVRTWNQHSIRKQPNRPHLVPGKPYMNYNFPVIGIENQGIQFNMDLFKRLQDDVQDWDIDEYLPPETYSWTRNQLLQLLYDPQQPPPIAGDHVLTPFRTIYLELRSRIQVHIQAGSQPILQLSQPPIGAFNWDPRRTWKEDFELVREVDVEYDQDQVEELEN